MSHQVLLDLLEHMYFWAPSEWLSDSARLLHTSLLLKEAAVALVLGGPLVGIILHIFDSWHGHNRAKSLYLWQYSQRLKSLGVGRWGWVGGSSVCPSLGSKM